MIIVVNEALTMLEVHHLALNERVFRGLVSAMGAVEC